MTIKLADDYARGYRYNLAVAYGGSPADAERVIKHIPKLVAGAKLFAQFQVSPVLGVHTGPGLLGIGVQRLGRLDKA